MTIANTSLQGLRLLSFIVLGLLLAGCGSSSDSRMSMDDGVDMMSMDDGTDMAPDMVDLGQWEIIREEVQPGQLLDLGYENTTHGLRARFDPNDVSSVSMTASSAMHQPTVAAAWRGEYWGFYQVFDRFSGDAQIDVTIQGSDVTATVTYSDFLGNQGFHITSDAAAIVDGRFAFTGNVEFSGKTLPYSGEGQFGGTDQRGVVGYAISDDFTSAFYGNRN